jgi:hypothetical protein
MGGVCGDFDILDHEIYINSLKKCNKTGKTVIQDIENFAKEKKIKTIKLSDDSHIVLCGHRISLAFLNILSKNKSWYNSLGYFTDQSKIEENENKKVLEMTMNSFLSTLKDFILTEISKLKSTNLYQEDLNKLTMLELVDDAIEKKIFTSLSSRDISVMQYFSQLKEKMRNENDFCKKEYEMLALLLKVISLSKLIKYTSVLLTKNIEVIGGRKKTKKRTNKIFSK